MFKPTVKINSDLWARIKRCSEKSGYATPAEFIEHVLDKEVTRLEEAESDQRIVDKLKGLGYLD